MANVWRDLGKFASSEIGIIFSTLLGIAGLALLPFSAVVGGILIGAGSLLSIASLDYLKESLNQDIKTGTLLQLTKRSNINLPILYGRCRIAGNIVFAVTTGRNNEFLRMAIVLGEGNNEIGNPNILFDDYPALKYKYVIKEHYRWRIVIFERVQGVSLVIRYAHKFIYHTANPYSSPWRDYVAHPNILKGTYPCNNKGLRWKYGYQLSSGVRRVNIPFTIYHPLHIFKCNTTSTDNVARTVAYYSGNNTIIDVFILSPYNNGTVKIENVIINEVSYDGTTYTTKTQNYLNHFDYAFEDTENGKIVGNRKIRDENYRWGLMKTKDVLYMHVFLKYNKDLFSGVPNISVTLDGKRVYDPRKGRYVFSDNPALIVYDFMTNQRYGFGIDKSRIDVQSIIDCADYCESKNFVFNAPITDGNGLEIIESILNHFRGYLIYRNGKFVLKYRDLNVELPVAHINKNEIIDGTFEINLPDLSEIPNTIKVNFIDPKREYTLNSIVIEDLSAVNEDKRQIEIDLMGATEEQAKILGAYYLERARLNQTVSFTTSPEFFNLEIGDIIKLTYKPYGIENKLFRITNLSVTEDGLCKITAILEDYKLYNDQVDLNIYKIDLTNLPSPDEPINYNDYIKLEEIYIEDKAGKKKSALKIEFNDTLEMVEKYEVWIKNLNSGFWAEIITTSGSPVIVTGLSELIEYEVFIRPINVHGIRGKSLTSNKIKILGKYKPPPDVENFIVNYSNGKLIFTWKEVEDLDLIGYEIRAGDDWETGEILVTNLQSTRYEMAFEFAENRRVKFMIKAKDSVGNYSENYASAVVTVEGKPERNVIQKFEVKLYDHTLSHSGTARFKNWAFLIYDTNYNVIVPDAIILYPQYRDQNSLNSYYGINDDPFKPYAKVDEVSYIMNFDSTTWDYKLSRDGLNIWDDWTAKYTIWAEPIPLETQYPLRLIDWETIKYDLGKVLKVQVYFDNNWYYKYFTVGIVTWKDIGLQITEWVNLGTQNDKWYDLAKGAQCKIRLFYSTISGSGYREGNIYGTEDDMRYIYLYAQYKPKHEKQTLIIKDYFLNHWNSVYYFDYPANNMPHIYLDGQLYWYDGIVTTQYYKSHIVVDVPDVIEKGVVSVSGVITVYYQKEFNKVKSIILTSQTDGKYPVLVDYNEQWFRVKMNDGGDGIVHYTVFGY